LLSAACRPDQDFLISVRIQISQQQQDFPWDFLLADSEFAPVTSQRLRNRAEYKG
jgi:3-methyladenine DNA glycosylase Mpg